MLYKCLAKLPGNELASLTEVLKGSRYQILYQEIKVHFDKEKHIYLYPKSQFVTRTMTQDEVLKIKHLIIRYKAPQLHVP